MTEFEKIVIGKSSIPSLAITVLLMVAIPVVFFFIWRRKHKERIKLSYLIAGAVVLALIVLPYIAAPIVHDYKMYRFDKSIGKIPAPEGYEKVAQKKWFGLLWACGNHADYLVIAVFRGAEDDRFIYNYFKNDFGVYCPEEEADAYPLIYKKTGGTYYWVAGEEAAEDILQKELLQFLHACAWAFV